jgi:hypothetical protein
MSTHSVAGVNLDLHTVTDASHWVWFPATLGFPASLFICPKPQFQRQIPKSIVGVTVANNSHDGTMVIGDLDQIPNSHVDIRTWYQTATTPILHTGCGHKLSRSHGQAVAAVLVWDAARLGESQGAELPMEQWISVAVRSCQWVQRLASRPCNLAGYALQRNIPIQLEIS